MRGASGASSKTILLMKAILTAGLLAISLAVIAQTKIERSFPVQGIKQVEFAFDYPELIKVRSWDKNEVMIKGTVTINRGEHDTAFELLSETSSNTLRISSRLRDKENIPRRTVIKKGDQEYFFKAGDMHAPEVQKFLEENGHEYTYISNGIQQDITLEIYLPKGMACRVDAKYGLVEIVDHNGPLQVIAPYGGIDATIALAQVGELTARTKFGEILTNLDTKFQSAGMSESHNDHWTEINAKPGNGPTLDLESQFGKVYLRKPE